jgi:hypothetical protein
MRPHLKPPIGGLGVNDHSHLPIPRKPAQTYVFTIEQRIPSLISQYILVAIWNRKVSSHQSISMIFVQVWGGQTSAEVVMWHDSGAYTFENQKGGSAHRVFLLVFADFDSSNSHLDTFCWKYVHESKSVIAIRRIDECRNLFYDSELRIQSLFAESKRIVAEIVASHSFPAFTDLSFHMTF